MSYSVVIKQPDGRLVEYCFPNAEAAEAAVTAPVSAPNTLPTE
jgi:roadblock/LC7 domain-containing protein